MRISTTFVEEQASKRQFDTARSRRETAEFRVTPS